MLREQVAEQLYDWDCLNKPYDCVEFGHTNSNASYWRDRADQILNLFKKEVDKLKEIDYEEEARAVNRGVDKAIEWSICNPNAPGTSFLSMREQCITESVKQTQLQADKDKLLALIGG
uniref:Uncharacterized protein n=1 Tax=viral metagenome TaxID=1070528 RepID=A0A6H1ZR08_9ZZZZ